MDGTLFLQIKPTGGKSWVQVVRFNGRRRNLGLGPYPLVSLAEAREQAFENRRKARAGIDPLRRGDQAPTFAEAAEAVIAIQRQRWREGSRSEHAWRAAFETHVFPLIGDKPVGDIKPADIEAVLKPLWAEKRESGRRIRHRISLVMKWAIGKEHRAGNPCDGLDALLPTTGGAAKVRHHKALPHGEVAEALAAMRGTEKYWPPAKLCFEFMVLTAARSGEARNAAWSEMDAGAALWTIPAERTKAGRSHRVPLSPQALAVLAEARPFRTGNGLVFPSERNGGAMRAAVLAKLVKINDIDAVPHGFRSSFRDWGAECTDAPREVLEAALAHTVANQAEAAYARTDHLERRRVLMDEWAAYLVDNDD